MFYRKTLDYLKKWMHKEDRKPLIIKGARQVGKTTLVDIFSKNFDQYLYFNLEKKEDRELFKSDLSIDDLISSLFLSKNLSRGEGKSLLFIDEIQNKPQEISRLRYFYEDAKDLYIITSGSLLDTITNKETIYPVGRVEFINMYPLTFREFLQAHEFDQLKDYYNKVPLPAYAKMELMQKFHKYALLGGMPEVIKKYIKRGDIAQCNHIYNNLLIAYKEDVKKYARNEKMMEIIKFVIERAPFEAGKRIKFHGFGNSNYRSREMGESLRKLQRAMLLDIIYPTTNVKPPLSTDNKKSPKLMFLDTGLINYSVGLQNYYFTMESLHSFYRGLLAEHIVGQELKANNIFNKNLSFWVRNKKQSQAEVDFVVAYKEYIIPIEVKSGKSGTLKSLHKFMEMTNHKYAVRFYAGDLNKQKVTTPSGKNFYLLNLPYCLAGNLKNYLDWFIG